MTRPSKHTIIWILLIAGIVALGFGVLMFFLHRSRVGYEEELKESNDRAVRAEANAERWHRESLRRDSVLSQRDQTLVQLLAREPTVIYVPRTVVQVDSVRVATTDTITVENVPYVPKAEYDQLYDSCSQYQVSCRSSLAAKDSLITAQDSIRAALQAMNAALERKITADARQHRLRQLQAFLLGGVSGAALCGLLCR